MTRPKNISAKGPAGSEGLCSGSDAVVKKAMADAARDLGRFDFAARIETQRLTPYDVTALCRLSRDPTSRKAGVEILLADYRAAYKAAPVDWTGQPWKTLLAVLFDGNAAAFDAMMAKAKGEMQECENAAGHPQVF